MITIILINIAKIGTVKISPRAILLLAGTLTIDVVTTVAILSSL